MEKAVVLLHEIYGLNAHMQHYANEFIAFGYDVYCPNFLQVKQPFSYEEEQMAYAHFMNQVGFAQGFAEVEKLIIQLKDTYKEIHIVGFSIGATIAWLCSELTGVTSVVGYYGSRIRNYLAISPLCPVLLIYGESEQSFNVKTLVAQLITKNIQVQTCEGHHGFADRYSPHFNEQSSVQALAVVKEFVVGNGVTLS
ncbi:dienelactone hydrolase family protein [Lysinibacillus sp. KU-BSD001]|uniref:dienelactone hydrolase family protein n=1 Tax=Lysinibacillus sp. KU-BSD001 TaxID=3141328 RepID=UPI0036F18E68